MTRGTKSMRWSVAVGMLAVLGLSACAKVPKPASDATPPEEVRWSVFDNGNSIELPANSAYTVPANRSITVWFHGKDSQGLQKISLATSVGWSCVNGNLGQNVGPGLAVPDTATFAPDANNMVPVDAIRVSNLSGPYGCSSGFTFVGGSAGFIGTATNWSNQTTTGTLNVKITP